MGVLIALWCLIFFGIILMIIVKGRGKGYYKTNSKTYQNKQSLDDKMINDPSWSNSSFNIWNK